MRFLAYLNHDLISEWSDCFLEICCGCGWLGYALVKLLLGRLGDTIIRVVFVAAALPTIQGASRPGLSLCQASSHVLRRRCAGLGARSSSRP